MPILLAKTKVLLILAENSWKIEFKLFPLCAISRKNYTANSWFSFWEKQNTQNEHIIAHIEYFLTCHYSKAVWLAENLNEIKITHYEKIFSHIKQKFSHFEKGLGINNIFVVSLRLPLFSPRYITLKQNQKIISKISNYLT